MILSGGKGASDAAENRNYLAARMTEELHEIIRVLQLTTYDEDEWDADNLTVMKKAHNAIQSKIRPARDWLLVRLSQRVLTVVVIGRRFWSSFNDHSCCIKIADDLRVEKFPTTQKKKKKLSGKII